MHRFGGACSHIITLVHLLWLSACGVSVSEEEYVAFNDAKGSGHGLTDEEQEEALGLFIREREDAGELDEYRDLVRRKGADKNPYQHMQMWYCHKGGACLAPFC